MEAFADHVARLRRDKGWSEQRLIREASGYEIEGTAFDTVRNAVRGRGSGMPSVVVIEAIARVLGVAANEFAAYRIQRALARLDPGVVGARSALANADLLLSQPIPEEVAEEAAQQREVPPPGGASSAPPRRKKGRAA